MILRSDRQLVVSGTRNAKSAIAYARHFPVGAARLWPLLLVSAALIVGCGGTGAPGQPIRLRLAHVYDVASPTHAFGAAHLGALLAEADVGLEVTVFPAAQLGNEAELLEQLVAGELELAVAGPSFLAMWQPPIGVFDAAYAFRDLNHMLEVARGDIAAPLWEELRRRYGVRVLDTWVYGARHITSNRPIRHPDDLGGFRLRLPGARVWQASGRSLGASPMPIAFSEVYMALQQGIADGQENPVPTILAMGFHEVQEYLNMTGHIQSSVQILVNERVWQRLNEPQREVLSAAVRTLGEDVYTGTERREREILDKWRESGAIRIVEDVDVETFRARAREFFAQGFEFSELYRAISARRDPPPGTIEGGEEIREIDAATEEEDR
jgi:TRAP-type transport system periplasmic protein